MTGKYALIIGNTEYTDPGLAQLTAPGKDSEDFARVLNDREICAFDDVNVLLNQPEYIVRGTIDEFFDQKKPDDLLVLYFSGHGIRDELGSLYLAVKNTIRTRLRSTAIKSDYIREAMDQSRSKRQVLILDCCNSGAFSQGTKAATGVSIGTASEFEAGSGRIILTASDSTQFAWEGNKVIGETDNSLFTHYLVQGLEGEADLDSDGKITVDELYDYAYEKVKLATPKQTPSKFSSRQQGEIVLRQIRRIEDIKPISLPDELIEATEDARTFVREGAVQQLEKLLKGKNLGLARSAREALEQIEREDDSRRVAQAATQALKATRQAEAEQKAKEESERLLAEQKAQDERRAKEEAERLTILKAEEERSAAEKAEADQRAKQESDRLSAAQKAEAEQKAREEAEHIAFQKAEEERFARERAETERSVKQKAEEEHIAKERAEEQRSARERAIAERKAKTSTSIQKVLRVFISIFSPQTKGKNRRGVYIGIGAATLLLVAWVAWPQLVYLSSNSINQQKIPYPVISRIRIQEPIDYEARSLLLKGIGIEVEIKTNSLLKNQPCEVIVYFQHPDNSPLTASRSFTTMISPYISKGNYVSVYTDITPEYDYSNFDVKLFIPYAAFANSGLPDGDSLISFYADIYRISDRSLITRSSSILFTYTK